MQHDSNDDSHFEKLLKEAAEDSLVFVPNTRLMEGRIVIHRQIGSGGMGVVYEATDRKLSTNVAVKVLSEVNPAGIYRLKQEFRALADVSHPNLVTLHELFFDRGQWFFTMELIPGRTLIEYLSPDDAPGHLHSLFFQLAEGIKAIHDAGKLHRDLKPNNVLVMPNGRVKILDFGLVSDQEAGGVGQTIVEEGISGTPTYMSPEQAASLPALPASDWYAFGVMLFEALTGRAPIEDTARTLITRKQTEDAPAPSSVRKGIPAALDALCLKLLARNPEQRPGFDDISKTFGKAGIGEVETGGAYEHPFVGRDAEMTLLEEAFRATDKGDPVVVFIKGLSGIGKTTLVERFLRRIVSERQAVVLRGRCYERESVPFKTCDSLIDELSRYIRRLPESRAARLMPRNVPALAKIFPVLNRLDVVRETRHRHPLPPDPNELRRIAFAAAKELLGYITAQEPLILYVDDLQWSDVDGARLLASIISKPDPPALMLIGSYRAEDMETSAGLATLTAQLEELDGADIRTIDLAQLSDSDSVLLAKELLNEDDTSGVIRQIANEGHGSPFIISELARFAEKSGLSDASPSLESAIATRIAALSEEERTIIEMLSVTASPLEEPLLAAALRDPNILQQLRSLEHLRLIRQSGGRTNKIAIYHDQIRHAVLSLLPVKRIQEHHQKIADALEGSPTPDPVALTTHLLGAHNPKKAGLYAAKAAHWAADILAFDNAARLFRIALEHNPGDRKNERKLQTALAEALSNAGYGPEAAEMYKKAAEGASPEESIELRRLAAQQWIHTGHMDEGMHELSAVLKTVGLKLHSSSSGSILDFVRNRIALRIRGLDFTPAAAGPLDKLAMLKLKTCESIMQGLWAADILQSAAFNAKYLRLALDLGSINDIVKSLAAESTFRSMKSADKKEVTTALLERADHLSEQVTDPEILAFLRLSRGLVFFFQSEFPESARHLRLAEQLCLEKCTRKNMTVDIAQSVLGSVYGRLGRWAELQTEWDKWVQTAKDHGNMYQLAMSQIWPMGCIRHLAEDNPEKARALLKRGLENWPFKKFNLPYMFGLQSQTYTHLYLGEGRKAFEAASASYATLKQNRVSSVQTMRVNSLILMAQSALSLATCEPGNPKAVKIADNVAERLAKERCAYAIPFVPFFRGMVAHLRGDAAAARSHLESAVIAFERGQFKLNSAATKYQLGRMVGGAEGQAMINDALRVIKTENIANPRRVASMLAPGCKDNDH